MSVKEIQQAICARVVATDNPDLLALLLEVLEQQPSAGFIKDFTAEDHAAAEEGLRQVAEGKFASASEVFARYGIRF